MVLGGFGLTIAVKGTDKNNAGGYENYTATITLGNRRIRLSKEEWEALMDCQREVKTAERLLATSGGEWAQSSSSSPQASS